jgi:hypothetical protein
MRPAVESILGLPPRFVVRPKTEAEGSLAIAKERTPAETAEDCPTDRIAGQHEEHLNEGPMVERSIRLHGLNKGRRNPLPFR